jgi:hypothetical protein
MLDLNGFIHGKMRWFKKKITTGFQVGQTLGSDGSNEKSMFLDKLTASYRM